MKNLLKLLPILAALFVLPSCSDDDMYFSEDIIVGDIITLDQSKVDNKVEMAVGGRRKINVQNAKGNVTATPSDDAVVTASVYKADCRHPEVTLSAKAAGAAEILIKDEKGHTAKLFVKVVE